MLNKAQEEMLSKSDITKADDTELIKISRNASTSIENLISHTNVQSQTDESIENSLCELSGFDKELKRIRGQLKLAVAKKLDLEEEIEKEKEKLAEIENPIEYTDDQHEEIENRIKRLNDELKARQEVIDILKGKLKNQITSIKEMIAKVLDKDTSLANKIRMLLREQGIIIASILTAIRMAIGVLIEASLPGGGGGATLVGPLPKDEKGLKEWFRNKFKALASKS